jgi:O-antigen/teichoic acid export membrane protein
MSNAIYIKGKKAFYRNFLKTKENIQYTPKKIIFNVLYILANQGLSKCLSFITVTFIIRALGPNDFGDYSYGLATVGYAGIFVNFGLSTYGSKQINQVSSKMKIEDIISEIVSLRLLIAFLTYIPFLLLYLFTNIEYLPGLLILNIKSFADAINVDWYFKGMLKNKFVVIATLMQTLTHLGAVLLLYKIYNLKIAYISLVISFIVLSVSQIIMLNKYLKIDLKLSLLNLSHIKSIIHTAWPFFFAGLFSLILFNTDTIFLKLYTNSKIVGYYNCAHRVIDVLSNIRFSVIGVLYPVFSQYFHLNPKKLIPNFIFSFKIVMSVILILTILIHIFAQKIILVLFGDSYSSSIEILKYLIIASLLLYANTFISALYNSIGYERKVFFSTLIAAVVNVVLNALLIPFYHVNGGIWATILALAIATGIMTLYFPEEKRKILSLENI